MKTFTAIAQRDPDTKFYVGYVSDFPRTDSQGETCMICRINLREVIKMLLKDEDLVFETEFVSTQQIVVYYTQTTSNVSVLKNAGVAVRP